MEVVFCPSHPDLYCLLKTGTKPGPSHGRSFYVCTKCQFVSQTKLPPVKCSIHADKMIELQSFVTSKLQQGLRKYFRCNGRQEGKSWCGFKQILQDSPGILPQASEVSTDQDAFEVKRDVKAENNGTVRCNVSEKDKKDELHQSKKQSDNDHSMHEIISCDEEEEDNLKKNGATCHEVNKSERSNDITKSMNGKETSAVSCVKESRDKTHSQIKKNKPTSQPLTFADLNKDNKKSGDQTDASFHNKSFHQYRESPNPVKRMGKTMVSKKDASSDSSDSDVEVQGAKEMLKALNVNDGNYNNSVVQTKQHIPHNGSNDAKLNVTSLKSDQEGIKVSEKRFESNDKSVNEKTNCSGEEDEKHSKPKTNAYNFEMVDKGDLEPRNRLKRLKEERTCTLAELHQFQASIRSVNLGSLPDKGQRLLARVASYKQHIASLDRQISRILQDHGDIIGDSHNHPESSQPQVIKVIKSSNVSSVSYQVVAPGSRPISKPLVSNNGGNIDNKSQIVQLPSHLSQYFADNPQAMTLYGGRMTAQRLREVGSITSEAIDKLHKQLESCPSETEELADPEGLVVTLMPHQRQALAWLEWREQQKPPGGILADDMGLGKTLTMLSHILKKKQEGKEDETKEGWLGKDTQMKKIASSVKKSRATLIVAPASLVHQWGKEIERRCKPQRLKFLIYHGPNRETNIHRLSDNDVVLTTYAIISKEIGSDGDADSAVRDDEEQEESNAKKLPLLLRIGWERIILDEAHDIKNHKSARAQSVSRLRAAYRWALTGTPIQNDLKDMYSLLRFLRFSPFDELKVWKKQIESAKVSTKRLNTLVKALLLRRTKNQTTLSGKPLVDLPEKTYESIKVELSAEERLVYDKIHKKTQTTVRAYVHRHQDLVKLGPSSTSSVRGFSQNESGNSSQTQSGAYGGGSIGCVQGQHKNTGSQILVFLLRLRQCCSHLSLMKSHLESESMETDGIELSLEQQMKGLLLEEDLKVATPTTDLPETSLFEKSALSTKLSRVFDKIKELRQENPSDKSVIVSQWTGMLEIVAHHLKKLGISHSLIQGNVPTKKRGDIVDDFNKTDGGAKVILISLCAGGVGLNLTGGNHLFLLDSHWNPALEEQACDRIYRIGQKKKVTIYRFICKDTIEEKIWMLQQGKLSMAKAVLSGAGSKNQKLSLDDLRLLFGI